MVLTKGREISLTPNNQTPTANNTSFDPLVVIKKTSNRKIVAASNVSPVLLSAKGNWFFDMFQDQLIIEEKRIIIKRRYFPYFTHIISIPVQRITVFEVTHSLFFSAVHIKGSYGDNWDTTFQWMSHKDAQKAKDIIDGLRLKESESVDLPRYNIRDFVRTLQVMGSV